VACEIQVQNSYRLAVFVPAAVLSVALLLGQAPQVSDDNAKAKAAAKAKQNAKNFENNATVITFFDREGKKVGTVGERALYSQPVMSPDRTRVAVIKNDLDAEARDLWVLDVATGKNTRITTSAARDSVNGPVWSPDGRQVAYVAMRNSSEAVYRKAVSGEGPEELLYKNPGAFLNLSDWSLDGRFLSFSKSDLSGGLCMFCRSMVRVNANLSRSFVASHNSSNPAFLRTAASCHTCLWTRQGKAKCSSG